MRFPDIHKLVQYYVDELFQLDTKEVISADPETYFYVNGILRKLKDYLKDPDSLGFERLPEERGKTAEELFEAVLEPYVEELRTKGWKHAVKTYDHLSLIEFFERKTNLSGSAMRMIAKLLNVESCYQVSFLTMLESYYNIFQGAKFFYLPNGADSLPRAFLNVLGQSRIVFDARVIKVAQDSRQVIAEYVQGFHSSSEKSSVTADYLLMTPSAPVVSFMEFQPPLSLRKRSALRRVYYDTCTKIALAFSRRFWEAEGIRGGKSTTDLPSRLFYYFPENSNSSVGVVLSYTWGHDSYLFTGLSENECLRIAVDNLAAIHGQYIRQLYIGGVVKHWLLDPFSLGAYAFDFPLHRSEIFEGFRDNEGRVWFSGDYTGTPQSWVETAVKTGLRAAVYINRKSLEKASGDEKIHVLRNEL